MHAYLNSARCGSESRGPIDRVTGPAVENQSLVVSLLPNASPPFAGRSPFPLVKGTEERIGVFKTQQEGGFIQFDGAFLQIMVGKFAARVFNELLKGDACIGEPTLKRACAQAEFLSDILQRRTFPGQ